MTGASGWQAPYLAQGSSSHGLGNQCGHEFESWRGQTQGIRTDVLMLTVATSTPLASVLVSRPKFTAKEKRQKNGPNRVQPA